MNVIFHALASFATAAVLSLKPNEEIWNLPKSAVGFFAGILVHAILDFLPHQYPLRSKFDVIFALTLLGITFFLAHKQNRFLILACFGGAIFPDVVDLSAGIANRNLGIPIPQLSIKIFPWHWKKFSGSIYDGSRSVESNIYHILVLLTCAVLIFAHRRKFFRLGN